MVTYLRLQWASEADHYPWVNSIRHANRGGYFQLTIEINLPALEGHLAARPPASASRE